MSIYRPADGIFVGRPPCADCGASFHLHQPRGGHVIGGGERMRRYDRGEALVCPTGHRPGSIEEARRILEDAERSGDSARIFAARGDVQRLEGRRQTTATAADLAEKIADQSTDIIELTGSSQPAEPLSLIDQALADQLDAIDKAQKR